MGFQPKAAPGGFSPSGGIKNRGISKAPSTPKLASPPKSISRSTPGFKAPRSTGSTKMRTLSFKNPFSSLSKPKGGVTGFGRGGAMSGASKQTDLSGTVK